MCSPCLESGFITARFILLMNDGVRVFSRGWTECASPFESTKSQSMLDKGPFSGDP